MLARVHQIQPATVVLFPDLGLVADLATVAMMNHSPGLGDPPLSRLAPELALVAIGFREWEAAVVHNYSTSTRIPTS
jgi:hypothetical protein